MSGKAAFNAREDWRIRIDGIEIDERRVQPHSRYLYNEVFVGDIETWCHSVRHVHRMTSIMFGDVLEHLPKSDAGLLMRQSVAHAQKIVLIRIPLGGGWRKEGREEPPIIIGQHGPWPISTNARDDPAIRLLWQPVRTGRDRRAHNTRADA